MRLCFLLLFLLICLDFTSAQPSEVQGGPWLPAASECLSEDQRILVRHRLQDNIKALREAGTLPFDVDRNAIVQFQFPMEWNNGFNDYGFYAISNFVDQDPAFPGMVEDYQCGQRTYDSSTGYNHRGIDYYLWPFEWNLVENDAVRIVAAAPGMIIGKDDGNEHFNCSFSSDNWNAVYLLHADGSTSWYGHMKKNSLTSKQVGEQVEAGEFLGIVGSSGSSTAPHLHFEVYDNNGDLVDPYAGPCNQLNEESWWIEQHEYIDPQINKIQTHFEPPVMHPCPQLAELNESDVYEPGSLIYFVTYFKDQRNTDLCVFKIIQPDGTLFDSWLFFQPQAYFSSSWWYWNAFIPFNAMEGSWKFQCEFDGDTYEHTFLIQTEATATKEQKDPGKFRIYAAGSTIRIDNLTTSGIEGFMQVYDMHGRVHFSDAISLNSLEKASVTDLAILPGMYWIQILGQDGSCTTEKFLWLSE